MNLRDTTNQPAAADDESQPVTAANPASNFPEPASSAVSAYFDLDEDDAPQRAGSILVPDQTFGTAQRVASGGLPATRNTAATHTEAETTAALCREFDRLIADPSHSLRTAAAALGKPASFFSGENSMYMRFKRHGVTGLLPTKRTTASTTMEVPPWFVVAAQFFYLLSNRTETTGSMPEAVRRTISLPNLPFGWTHAMRQRLLSKLGLPELPECPVELREQILARQAAGKPLVPPSIARQIIVNPTIVKFHRSPRDWSLDNLSAPGSQRRYNTATGERLAMAPGDWFGGDDSTPGIAVCVPVSECDVRTPTSMKYQVLVGRFQWLPYHDAATDKILAWDYVIRPRGSYRAEDILNGMGAVVRTHGIPRQGWQFEGGTWNSKLVQNCIKVMYGDGGPSEKHHWRTYSPHQKAIESIFNRIWTRLAVQFPHADMGRYRSENESNCHLYEACKAAHKDPRHYFPSIGLVLAVLTEEVAAHNTKLIKSTQYGTWIPDNFFAQQVAKNPLRQFSPEMEWMFAPYAAERTVRGMIVGCRVPMFENFSVPFEFGADWLPAYAGQKVRIHFNPRQPKCRAKVVLVDGGKILGDANLIGDTGGYIRYLMEWGDDNQRAGYLARQKVNNFVRRETRGIGVGGRVEYSKSEQRDGVSKVATVEQSNGGANDTGTDDPARPRPAMTNGHETVSSYDRAARSESSEAANHQTNEREARKAELAALEHQTAHLFQ